MNALEKLRRIEAAMAEQIAVEQRAGHTAPGTTGRLNRLRWEIANLDEQCRYIAQAYRDIAIQDPAPDLP